MITFPKQRNVIHFSSNREFIVPGGMMGITINEDIHISEMFGDSDITSLSNDECKELALHMIERWKEFGGIK